MSKPTIQVEKSFDKLRILNLGEDGKEIIRTIKGRGWNGGAFAWEIPFYLLCELKRKFKDYEIQYSEELYNMLSDKSDRIKKANSYKTCELTKLPYQPKTSIPLFDYQLRCVNFLVEMRRAGLFTDMGTGKAKIIVHTFEILKQLGIINRLIIICSKSLKENEVDEIIIHAEDIYKIQVIKTGKTVINTSADILIINYDILEFHKYELEKLAVTSMVTIDECHKVTRLRRISNEKLAKAKKQGKILTKGRTYHSHQITKVAPAVYLASGTPIQNKNDDVWSLLYMICPEEVGEYYTFTDQYCVINTKFGSRRITGYKNTEELSNLLENYSIRYMADEVLDLPERHFINHTVELNQEQKTIYNTLKKNLVLEIKNKFGEDVKRDAKNVLDKLLKLMQVCVSPSLVGHNCSLVPSKIEALDTLLDDLINKQQEKVIVVTSWRDINFLLKDRYSQYNPQQLLGGMSENQRNQAKDEFQNKNSSLMLLHPEVGGEGFTLIAARYIVYLDRDFSLIHWLQSKARIWRIGQDRDCYIIIITAANTIDDKINADLIRKESLANKILKTYRKEDFFSKDNLLDLLDENELKEELYMTDKFDFDQFASNAGINIQPADPPPAINEGEKQKADDVINSILNKPLEANDIGIGMDLSSIKIDTPTDTPAVLQNVLAAAKAEVQPVTTPAAIPTINELKEAMLEVMKAFVLEVDKASQKSVGKLSSEVLALSTQVKTAYKEIAATQEIAKLTYHKLVEISTPKTAPAPVTPAPVTPAVPAATTPAPSAVTPAPVTTPAVTPAPVATPTPTTPATPATPPQDVIYEGVIQTVKKIFELNKFPIPWTDTDDKLNEVTTFVLGKIKADMKYHAQVMADIKKG